VPRKVTNCSKRGVLRKKTAKGDPGEKKKKPQRGKVAPTKKPSCSVKGQDEPTMKAGNPETDRPGSAAGGENKKKGWRTTNTS